MSDLREAAEMALEFVDWLCGDDHSVKPKNNALKTREALRQALAMERFSEVSQEIEEAMKQEPAAWLYQTAYGDKFIHKKEQAAFHQPNGTFTPLYTAPPKREWVGLTDEEAREIRLKVGSASDVYARAIEAALKEKNSG